MTVGHHQLSILEIFTRKPYSTPQNKHGTWKWTPEKGDSYWKPSFSGSMLVSGGVRVLNPKRRCSTGRMCVFPFWHGNPRILGCSFRRCFFSKPNRLLFLEKSQQNPGRKPQASVWYHPTSGTNSPVFSHGRFTEDRLLTPPLRGTNERIRPR